MLRPGDELIKDAGGCISSSTGPNLFLLIQVVSKFGV